MTEAAMSKALRGLGVCLSGKGRMYSQGHLKGFIYIWETETSHCKHELGLHCHTRQVRIYASHKGSIDLLYWV